MNRDQFAAWYRSLVSPRPESSESASSVAMAAPRRPFKKKYVVWLIGGTFIAVELLGLLTPKHTPTIAKSSLTDQSAPAPTTRSAIDLAEQMGKPNIDQAVLDRDAEARRRVAAELVDKNQQVPPQAGQPIPPQTPEQVAEEERKRRDEESLLASTLIPIADAQGAPGGVPRNAELPGAHAAQRDDVVPAAPPVASVPSPPEETGSNSGDTKSKDCVDKTVGGITRYALCEGEVVPAVLDNRIVGEFAGPAKAYVLYNVLSHDKKHVILPRGTVVLGQASPVAGQNQRRIPATFQRFLMPDGRGFVLSDMLALDQAGETALSGKVNRHLLQTFGTAALVGALAGFSQFGASSAYTGNGIDAYRQQVAGSTAQQGQTILQRDLNRPASITIPEGKLINIYIKPDLYLPEYAPAGPVTPKTGEQK